MGESFFTWVEIFQGYFKGQRRELPFVPYMKKKEVLGLVV